jgi:hypothetical protein
MSGGRKTNLLSRGIAGFRVSARKRGVRELDEIYRQFDEIVAEDGRSEYHFRWLHDKATALLLQVESGFAEIVASAIRQAIHDLQHPPSPPQDVLSVPATPSRPAWLAFLLTAPRLLV